MFREEGLCGRLRNKNVLLSKEDGEGINKDKGRISCIEGSKYKQDREILHKKVLVLIKIFRNRAL
jgi:hypothetical protein